MCRYFIRFKILNKLLELELYNNAISIQPSTFLTSTMMPLTLWLILIAPILMTKSLSSNRGPLISTLDFLEVYTEDIFSKSKSNNPSATTGTVLPLPLSRMANTDAGCSELWNTCNVRWVPGGTCSRWTNACVLTKIFRNQSPSCGMDAYVSQSTRNVPHCLAPSAFTLFVRNSIIWAPVRFSFIGNCCRLQNKQQKHIRPSVTSAEHREISGKRLDVQTLWRPCSDKLSDRIRIVELYCVSLHPTINTEIIRSNSQHWQNVGTSPCRCSSLQTIQLFVNIAYQLPPTVITKTVYVYEKNNSVIAQTYITE